MDTISHIKEKLQPILDNYKAELVDLNIQGSKSSPVLQILADKEGGIKLDECTAINKELAEILENNPSMQKKYILEVSSPGLDRALKTKKDFEKTLNEEVNIYLKIDVEGRNYYKAIIDSADDESVKIKTKQGQLVNIPYTSIQKAKREIRF